MKKLSALISFFFLFIIYLFLTKPVFADFTCNEPYSGGTYTQGDGIILNTSASGLSAIPVAGTLAVSYYLGGGYVGQNSAYVSPPVQDTATDSYTAYPSAGTYNGWSATLSFSGDDGSYYSLDCSNGGTFTVNPPPTNLQANVSFSGMSPTGGTLDNPVTFSGTIYDNEPNSGTRTVNVYVDGALISSSTYFNNAGYSGSGSYTVPTPPYTGHSWYITVSMAGSTAQSSTYSFNITAPPIGPVTAPESLSVFCSAQAYGVVLDGNGIQWCKNESITYSATFYAPADQPATLNYNVPIGQYLTVNSPSSSSTVRYGSVTSSTSLTNGIYSWEAWSSGTGWESPHSSATFGIDNTPPSSGPGTPYLTKDGSIWKIIWGSNGSDTPSGIGFAFITIKDDATGCQKSLYPMMGASISTETPFSDCPNDLQQYPTPGHTYTFTVTTCDFALNCGPISTGSYDGSITLTYSIYGNVFIDYNGDGIKNTSAGFPPDEEYPGGDVQIYMNGTPTTNTDGFGNYAISGLTNANYSLEAVPPASYIVSTANPITAFINNADSTGNDFGIQPLGGPLPTPTPPPAGYPVIKTLKTKNPQTLTFTGSFGTSGRQNTENGSKWFNPMRIRLSVEQGTNSINTYFVAFYDKSSGTKLTNKDSFITDIKARLSNPKNGFLLAYGLGNEFYISPFNYDYLSNNYYVWNKNTWQKITTSSFTVCNGTCSGTNELYTATKIAANIEAGTGYRYVTWEIKFKKDLGSKLFYTPALVIDQAGQSDFNSSLTVTELLN